MQLFVLIVICSSYKYVTAEDTSTIRSTVDTGEECCGFSDLLGDLAEFVEFQRPNGEPTDPTRDQLLESNSEISGNQYPCLDRAETFNGENSCEELMIVHETSLSYKFCGISFIGENRLQNHMETHSDGKLEQCYKNGKAAQDEIRKMFFSCKACKKEFKSKRNLKVHMRIHTGEKPFACSICDKRFSDRSNMRSHEKLHSRVKKTFFCPICGAVFAWKENMYRHYRLKHANERPISCYICGRLFARRIDLETHMESHNDEKPYSCDICGENFIRRSNWVWHMDTIHGRLSRPTSSRDSERGGDLEHVPATSGPSVADISSGSNQHEPNLLARVQMSDTRWQDECSRREVERVVECIIRLNRGSRDPNCGHNQTS